MILKYLGTLSVEFYEDMGMMNCFVRTGGRSGLVVIVTTLGAAVAIEACWDVDDYQFE